LRRGAAAAGDAEYEYEYEYEYVGGPCPGSLVLDGG
jgi:hypothetical protein